MTADRIAYVAGSITQRRLAGFRVSRVAVVVALLVSSAGSVFAQALAPDMWVTDGQVAAVARDGNVVYIAGDFTRVGPPTGGGAAVDAGTGATLEPYPRVTGEVHAVAADGSGGWYLGGWFTAVRGQARANLAHLDASGNLTAWNPSANDTVKALLVSGGTVYAGGRFTNIGGETRHYLAALDGAGAATAWNPDANGGVLALAMIGSTVYAGGEFTSIGGQARDYLAGLDASGVATAWSSSPNGLVRALAVAGTTLYAGGDFTEVSAYTRQRVAAFDAAGTLLSWYANANGRVYAVASNGATVWVGGQFTMIAGQARNHIASINATNGVPFSWNPNASGGKPGTSVNSILVTPGTIYVGGNFSTIGGQARNHIAAINATTGLAASWNPFAVGADHMELSYARLPSVNALAIHAGTLFVGGRYASIGGQPRSNIAALDATSGVVTAWNPGVVTPPRVFSGPGVVWDIEVSGGVVYIAGHFKRVGGQARESLAAVSTTTGAVLPWNPTALACCDNALVRTLAVSGSTIYMGGYFEWIGGQQRYRIAAVDAAGITLPWYPDGTGIDDVYALAVSDGLVYVGGYFGSIGGQARNHLAAVDATTGVVTPWNPNVSGGVDFNPDVFAIAVSGGIVYAGGDFTQIGGQPRKFIAAIDATGAPTSWDPNATVVGFQLVQALAVNGNTVYAAGAFNSMGGQARNCLAALDATTGAATDWDPNVINGGMIGGVLSLAVSQGTVYAAGNFSGMSSQPQAHIGAITEGYILPVNDRPRAAKSSLTVSPNPARAAMQIQYSLARAGSVRLELVDVAGRVVATLADRVHEPGRHSMAWNGAVRNGRLAPGLHFLRLVAPEGVMVTKLVVVQ